MTTDTDVRAKAAAILSGHKLRQLEAVGLTVVDKRRLEALERLYGAEKRRHAAVNEKCPLGDDFDYDYATEEERKIADEWARQNSTLFHAAEDEIDAALMELEASERE